MAGILRRAQTKLLRGRAATSILPSRLRTPKPNPSTTKRLVASCPDPGAPLDTLQGRTCFIQGASRGLGLEFVRQLLELPGTRVFASCRSPSTASQLQALAGQHGHQRLQLLQLDVTEDPSIEAAAQQTAAATSHLDLLVNCTGVLHIPGQVTPETGLGRLSQHQLMLSFQTNAIGPMLVCKALAPLLVAAAKDGCASEAHPAVIANMSARVGSIGDNRLGGWYSYRSSKAALNQLTRTMSLDFERRRQKVTCVLLHPGTCDTGLSEPFQMNVPEGQLFTAERGVRQLLGLIASTGLADNGKYLAWDGKEIPW